jgi:thioredoxin-related protein
MRYLLCFALIELFIAHSATADEVKYYNKSWDEIRKKAKQEHKYIFLDCYTQGCTWCKVMDKETLVNPDIVKSLNTEFIPVKMDMEKGEGIKVAMKYHLVGYPTYLFFTPDGDFVYQNSGYFKPDDFAVELKKATDKETQTKMPGYSKSLDVPYPEFYSRLFIENGHFSYPTLETVDSFLGQQKDLFDEVSWAIFAKFEVGERYQQLFLKSLDKFAQQFGNKAVTDEVWKISFGKFQNALKKSDKVAFEDCLKFMDKYLSDNQIVKLYYKMTFYKSVEDWPKCVAATNEDIKVKGYEDSSTINDIAWTMYEKCSDKMQLLEAKKWMEQLTSMAPSYAFMDTYAALLYKCGQKKDAEIWAIKAIAAGKTANEDTNGTEQLLLKIKAMK